MTSSHLRVGIAAVALAFAASSFPRAPALADPPPWAHGGRDKHHGHGHDEDDDDDARVVVTPPPPVVVVTPAPIYAPPPPQPVYVAPPPPPPVYVAPPPAYVEPTPVVVAPAPPSSAPFGLAENTCHRDLIGAAIGGAGGGLIGNQFGKGNGKIATTLVGVLGGALVGGMIGRSMDERDQACTSQVLQYTPDRQTVVWQGADQQGYWVTPMRSYYSDGRYCREYESRSLFNGRVQVVTSHACRGSDGAWVFVN